MNKKETNYFDAVTQAWGSLKYMSEPQAKFLRQFLTSNGCYDILEIGFFHGKSSAYIAAILEDFGSGHLTTIDHANALRRDPPIQDVLDKVGLSRRVQPIFAHRSFTWELANLLKQRPRPQFDFCYFDGGHTWDVTGFGFVLVDMLLKPGGWIIFDDLDWTIERSISRNPSFANSYKAYSADERTAPGVRLVWDLLVPHFGYVNRSEQKNFHWGIAQKPAETSSGPSE